MTCRFRGKADSRVRFSGRVYEFTPKQYRPQKVRGRAPPRQTRCLPIVSLRSRSLSAAPPPTSVGEPTHSASTEPCFRRLRCCSCAGSQRNVPAPLYFRAPLALESCAQSSQLYTVAPAAAPRHAGRSCSASRRGRKLAPWMRRTPLPLTAAAVARFGGRCSNPANAPQPAASAARGRNRPDCARSVRGRARFGHQRGGAGAMR